MAWLSACGAADRRSVAAIPSTRARPHHASRRHAADHQSSEFSRSAVGRLAAASAGEFLARENLFRVPFIGWVLRNTYVLPINRESAGTGALREMIARLKAGFWVGIFPEGTRSADGKLGEMKPGFLALLRRADVPVCPVGIAGADRAARPVSQAPHFSTVRVVFGEPISAAQVAETLTLGEAALLDLIRTRLEECMGQACAWRDHK